jgi:hypothetical protein
MLSFANHTPAAITAGITLLGELATSQLGGGRRKSRS